MLIKTPKQIEAIKLLSSKASRIMLEGGSRSGKSAIIIYALITRAIKTKSRHVVLRQHFNHVKQSIVFDTFPKIFKLAYPDVYNPSDLSRSDWYYKFPNGSEIFFSGLDDKDRTEKILGNEYSSIFFNECSQLSYKSVTIAETRLAERSALKNKLYFDQNPARKRHWAYKMFRALKNPVSGEPLDPSKYACMLMNPRDNLDNIDPDYIDDILENLPPLLKARFLEGKYGSDDEDIFLDEWMQPSEKVPNKDDIAAVFTMIDPAYTEKTSMKDDKNDTDPCESGIVTVAVTYDDNIIVDVDVRSGMWNYQELKNQCKQVYDKFKWCQSYWIGVEEVAAQKWLIEDLIQIDIPCIGMKPDQDKVRRAISVTDIMAEGRTRVNSDALRKQLEEFPTGKLKDLTDAYVYCLRLVKQYSEKTYKSKDKEYEKLDSNTKRFYNQLKNDRGAITKLPHEVLSDEYDL